MVRDSGVLEPTIIGLAVEAITPNYCISGVCFSTRKRVVNEIASDFF